MRTSGLQAGLILKDSPGFGPASGGRNGHGLEAPQAARARAAVRSVRGRWWAKRRVLRTQGAAFKEARLVAGLTRKQAADMVGVSVRTVRSWEACRSSASYAAFKLMRITTGYALPGEHWRGWSLRGGLLVSPAGQSFEASSMGYLSLVFAMARHWLRDRGYNGVLPADKTLADRLSVHGRAARAAPDGAPPEARASGSRMGKGGVSGHPLPYASLPPLSGAPQPSPSAGLRPLGLSLYNK
jgi:transcriptional regulator with XRE-family HTH domain